MNKTKKFLATINKKIKPVAHIVEWNNEDEDTMLRFKLEMLYINKYFRDSILNVTDDYVQLIENTVLDFFNTVPDFNNDGSIFFFQTSLDNKK